MSIPLPVITGVHRVAINSIAGGQFGVNVFHLKANVAELDPGTVGAACVAAWQTNQWAQAILTDTVVSFEVTPLDGHTAPVTTTTPGSGKFLGVQSGDFITAACAIIKLTTSQRGAANRGRLFLPRVAEAVQSSGQLQGSLVGSLTTAWQGFSNALFSGPSALIFGVASYDRKHQGAGAHFNPAVGINCEPYLGTQRRRQTRVRGG